MYIRSTGDIVGSANTSGYRRNSSKSHLLSTIERRSSGENHIAGVVAGDCQLTLVSRSKTCSALRSQGLSTVSGPGMSTVLRTIFKLYYNNKKLYSNNVCKICVSAETVRTRTSTREQEFRKWPKYVEWWRVIRQRIERETRAIKNWYSEQFPLWPWVSRLIVCVRRVTKSQEQKDEDELVSSRQLISVPIVGYRPDSGEILTRGLFYCIVVA